MKTATEMQVISKEAISTGEIHEIVVDQIEAAAAFGRYDVTLTSGLTGADEHRLQDLGYKVTRDKRTVIISWGP